MDSVSCESEKMGFDPVLRLILSIYNDVIGVFHYVNAGFRKTIDLFESEWFSGCIEISVYIK